MCRLVAPVKGGTSSCLPLPGYRRVLVPISELSWRKVGNTQHIPCYCHKPERDSEGNMPAPCGLNRILAVPRFFQLSLYNVVSADPHSPCRLALVGNDLIALRGLLSNDLFPVIVGRATTLFLNDMPNGEAYHIPSAGGNLSRNTFKICHSSVRMETP